MLTLINIGFAIAVIDTTHFTGQSVAPVVCAGINHTSTSGGHGAERPP